MIVIDYQNRKPIYEQVTERFRLLIAKGVLEPDSQMPSVRTLAMQLSINPNTIQKAYSLLEQDGFIYSVKGKGSFVTDNAKLADKIREGFLEDFRIVIRQGIELGVTRQQCEQQIDTAYREVKT